MAFAELEPFGGGVEDMRAGLGPSAAINIARVPAEGQPMPDPVQWYAFYPWHKPPPPPEPPEDTPEERSEKIMALLNSKAKAVADGQ